MRAPGAFFCAIAILSAAKEASAAHLGDLDSEGCTRIDEVANILSLHFEGRKLQHQVTISDSAD